ncbi:MAG: flagellar biosynthetic protein FliO [Terracidiphilus sp.]|nr:flagellar biosynthetic protein FliO [Terracidiphilus sp.]
MNQEETVREALTTPRTGGLTGWLLGRLRVTRRPPPRLELLERIALAPRQSLALVEAEGRRFLVATSAEGGPAFYALDEKTRTAGFVPGAARPATQRSARVSW